MMENTNDDIAIYSNASDLSSLVSTPSDCLSEEESSVTDGVPVSLIEKKLLVSDDATLAVLNSAIVECKKMVLNSEERSSERELLVRYLVELRYRAQELKDAGDNPPTKMALSIFGHHFKQYGSISTSVKRYCDHCSGVIWSVVLGSYVCRDCSYICHSKCVKSVMRVCVHTVICEKGSLEMTICAEKGLSAQRYRCAECGINIGFTTAHHTTCFGRQFFTDDRWSEPRLCDYSGKYFCATCHWNNVSEIPARIVHNWDWEKKPVSQAAYQLLTLTKDKPLINLEEINKNFFLFITEMDLVRKLRGDLIVMRQYLMLCETGSTLITRDLLHLVETPNLYSVAQLEMVKDGILTTKLVTTSEKWRAHILECEVCSIKGHKCELCQNENKIFPFDSSAAGCQKCKTVFHRLCWTKNNHVCPRCITLSHQYETEESGDEHDNIL